MRCEARTLDDIRALGGNDLADERRFAAAARRLGDQPRALPRLRPARGASAVVTPPMAEAMRRMHPLRLSYEMFGPRNPLLAWVADAAERVRGAPAAGAAPTTRFLAVQEQVSQQIVDGLEAWRKATERLSEETFHAIYGTPALQAALGIDTSVAAPAAQGARRACCTTRWSSAAIAELARRDDPRRAARGAGPRAALRRHGARTASTSAASRRSAGSATPIPTQPADDARRRSRRWCASSTSCCSSTRRRRSRAIPALLPEADRGAPRGLRRAPRGARGERRARRRAGRAAAAASPRSSGSAAGAR